MRHNKTFKKGTDYEDIILWIQSVVKYEREVISTPLDSDHPSIVCVLSDDFNISIMKSDNIKKLK